MVHSMILTKTRLLLDGIICLGSQLLPEESVFLQESYLKEEMAWLNRIEAYLTQFPGKMDYDVLPVFLRPPSEWKQFHPE